MFRGINTVNLDIKNRIAIPARSRDFLIFHNQVADNNQLIVTIDPEEHCLLMYPLIFWEEIEKKIESLPSFNAVARRIQRLLIGHATEVLLDNQGRILLPQELREYAGLRKRVILVGQGKKIEIWDFDNWFARRKDWLAACSVDSNNLPEDLQVLSL